MKRFWNPRTTFWLRIIILICGLFANVNILNNYRNVESDFVPDYIAATSLRGGGSLYGEHIKNLEKEMLGFNGPPNFHPPFNALLYLPLSFFYYNTAFILLSVISIVFLFWINQFIVRELKLGSEWFLNLMCFTLLWYPVFNCLGSGQSSMIITFCLIIGWFSLRHSREYVSGLFFAIATLIKLFPGLVLLYLLISKNWRALFAMIFFIVIGLSLTAFIVGFDDMKTYAITTVARDVDDFRGYVLNHSIGGIVSRLFGKQMGWFEPLVELPHIASLLIILLSIGVLVYTILKLREMAEKKECSDYAFGLTLVTMLLLSPITWSHIFPVLILPLGLLLREYIEDSSPARLRLLLLILFCLSLPDVLIARALVSIHYPLKIPFYGRILTLGPGLGVVLLWIVLARRAGLITCRKPDNINSRIIESSR
jgi:hypothetical protein